MSQGRTPARRHPASRRPGRPRAASDGETARLFIAVRPPDSALAELAHLVDDLATARAGARLTDRSRWHITVAFLGEVPESRVGDASAALTAAAERAVPVRLRIAGGGRFGRGRFTVLWAGIAGETEQDLPAFGGMARAVRRELRRARLPYDEKPFRPHLTLARPGGKLDDPEIRADVETLRGSTGAPFTVDQLWLYRSRLGPDPSHTPVSHCRL
ncbi:MAG: RNA 2',3'-cyclic phosphodiesterase [Actinocatenispora sp.]